MPPDAAIRTRAATALLVAVVAATAACADTPEAADGAAGSSRVVATTEPAAVTTGAIGSPSPALPVTATWQWQLQGELNTSYDVDVYDIDLFDTPIELIASLHADGRTVICYFSAGSRENYRPDADDFAPSAIGDELDGWDNENWLDVRDTSVRAMIEARLDLATEKGCDGVEPDNVDGYTNDSGFDYTAADQLDFNRFLAEAAHARGLLVGLKNALDQVPALVGSFDFAVNEQCFEYDECDALQPFLEAGKPVFNAEYAESLRDDHVEICAAARQRGMHTLILPLDLNDSFRVSCDP